MAEFDVHIVHCYNMNCKPTFCDFILILCGNFYLFLSYLCTYVPRCTTFNAATPGSYYGSTEAVFEFGT